MTRKTLLGLLAVAGQLGTLLLTANSAIVMIDFGADGAYAGNNSPAHAEGLVPASNTTWTQLGGADATVGSLNYASARSSSEGLSDGDFFDFVRDGATISAAGGSGIWGTGLTNDSLVDITSANRRDPIAIALEGFAPGDYYVFVVAHHGQNLSVPLIVDVDVREGIPANGNISFSTLSGSTVNLTPDVDTSTWTLGSDYAKFTVSITDTLDTLLVAVNNPNNDGTGNDYYGSITALQVVAVPEPATYAALLGLLALGLVAWRRRR
jgi:hypothetical protein